MAVMVLGRQGDGRTVMENMAGAPTSLFYWLLLFAFGF
jgi:hypothetical protein